MDTNLGRTVVGYVQLSYCLDIINKERSEHFKRKLLLSPEQDLLSYISGPTGSDESSIHFYNKHVGTKLNQQYNSTLANKLIQSYSHKHQTILEGIKSNGAHE